MGGRVDTNKETRGVDDASDANDVVNNNADQRVVLDAAFSASPSWLAGPATRQAGDETGNKTSRQVGNKAARQAGNNAGIQVMRQSHK